MISLVTLIVFLFMLVLIYPAVMLMVAAAAFLQKTRSVKRNPKDFDLLKEIDRQTDRLKDRAFTITVILTFFFGTPLVVLFWIFTTP